MDRLSIGLYMSMQSASINLMILVHTPKIPKHYHIVSWMTILVKFCHESWFNVKMKCDSLCSWVVVGGNQHNGSILNGLQKLHQRFNICKTGITCQLFNMINGFLLYWGVEIRIMYTQIEQNLCIIKKKIVLQFSMCWIWLTNPYRNDCIWLVNSSTFITRYRNRSWKGWRCI